ncbi:flagellar basal body rod protein FlgB (plasmid) [Pontibacillus sp. ALD_SL1]|uniref:flagellar basal body rod protein FlgB n=1 Tax=Pontibacillus sp. ALD_SL1 TaxID=2777185 RepID=UPI001A97CC59|nr:flagellar basal body rod protein FlgB [Pontibacillus sp. ALD_SL1]QST03029.1 flagellar basal body rod protein FlgB [Pontibacillus sp. ALD_SL1]
MFGEYINFIETNMNFAAKNRSLISDNIGNYNTPDYKTKRLDEKSFERTFPMITSNDQHIQIDMDMQGGSGVYEETKGIARPDGNNVDLSIEMIEMIKNNTRFNQTIQAINKEFMLNKIAIGK